jgi:hypothetical protein
MKDKDRTPTLAECLEEWGQKKPLLEDIEALKKERDGLTVTVRTLRDIEQSLRKSIVQLSHTLGQLYELNASLVSGCTPRIDTSAEH